MRQVVLLILILISFSFAENPVGFQGALWGDNAATVQQKTKVTSWTPVTGENQFPPEMNIQIFSAPQTIAGYKTNTHFYFYKDQFFQVTVNFDFDEFKTYDVNTGYFHSVDNYYREIRNKSLLFVADIYELLQYKYGRKQPNFKGVDPRYIFSKSDSYIEQERWNLRYHSTEYYKRIKAQAYARWRYPKTEINFSVNISAADKRFDYTLSLTSLTLARTIEKENKKIRSTGL